MGWLDYYRLLERHNGNLNNITKGEFDAAAKANPNDPDSAMKLAKEKYQEEGKKIIPLSDDWKADQEVVYKLIVTVNDEEVFESEYASADDLYEEARKPEGAVAGKLQSEFDYEHKQGMWEEDDDDEGTND